MHRGQFRKRSSPEEINRGVGMLGSGVWQWRVAGILNVSQSVISRMWNRRLTHRGRSFTQTGPRMRQGNNSKSGRIFVDSVSTSMVSERYVFGTKLRTISTQPVRNRLQEFGLNARRPVIRVPLTSSAGEVRLCQNVRWAASDIH